jgi:hypothetical protein
VTTEGKRTCPVCRALFPDNSDSCPVCALRGALGNEATVAESILEPTLLGSQFRFEQYEVRIREDGTPPFEDGPRRDGDDLQSCRSES